MKQFFKKILIGALSTWLGFFLVFLTFGVLAGLFIKGLEGRTEPIAENSVLHLDLQGELTERTRPFDLDFLSLRPFSEEQRGVGLYELTKAVAVAKQDPRIKGIYLDLRDLDSGWASSEALRRALVDFKESGKFIYAYGASMDEKTYFLASAAEKIYLHPFGELELNGLSIDGVFLKETLSKLEIEPRIFRVGKFKSAVEPFLYEKMSEDNRQQNLALVNDIWSVFKTGILKPATLEEKDIERMATELEINSPKDAFDKGLIHELAYEDEVLAMISEQVGADDILENLVSPGQLLAQTSAPARSENKIAVLFAEGEISSGMGSRDSIGAESFVEELRDIQNDESVKALVIRVKSPGGDALASDIIWREITLVDKKIPVIASMSDVAASGGYYIAAGARQIFAEASTLTGSIGVFGLMFGTQDFFNKKIGMTFDQVNSHPYADLGNPNRPLTGKEESFIQSSVERTYKRFTEVVAESREFPETADPSQFAEGRVWSGLRAKELKLVDEIGGLDSAIQRAAEIAGLSEGNYEIALLPHETARLEELLDMLSGQVSKSLLKGTVLENLRSSLPLTQSGVLQSGVYARIPFDLKIK